MSDTATYTVTLHGIGPSKPSCDKPAEPRPATPRLGYAARAVATIAVCVMGMGCMWLTDGTTGVGWAILGVLLIWCGY